MNKATVASKSAHFEGVCRSAIHLVRDARKNVLRAVNYEQVLAYWRIGRLIVEQEQKGEGRAAYGRALLRVLSDRLTVEFEKGFSVTNLKYMRKFYLMFGKRNGHVARDQFQFIDFKKNLSWTHYRLLLSEPRDEVRTFYEIEADKNHWSTIELKRQMSSFLFERIACSKDEQGVKRLASRGLKVEKPEDALKSPLILDFLGYKDHHQYTESDLETAIIDHLQEFLLELGTGFAFADC